MAKTTAQRRAIVSYWGHSDTGGGDARLDEIHPLAYEFSAANRSPKTTIPMKSAPLVQFLVLFVCLGLCSPSLWPRRMRRPGQSPTNDLRGRLVVLPPLASDPLHCRVFLELENTENTLGQRKVRFAMDKLTLQVVDKDGKPLEVSHNPYSGMSPNWEPMLLPFGGTIRFPINLHGLGHPKDLHQFIIDRARLNFVDHPATGDYFLTGTLAIPQADAGPFPISIGSEPQFSPSGNPKGKITVHESSAH